MQTNSKVIRAVAISTVCNLFALLSGIIWAVVDKPAPIYETAFLFCIGASLYAGIKLWIALKSLT